MTIKNPKTIALIMLITGSIIVIYWGFALFKTIYFPIIGKTTDAIVIGFKISKNGAKITLKNNNLSNTLIGRSPFFCYYNKEGKKVTSYSHSPHFFFLFNYHLNEKVKVAYLKNESIILNWKEIPGLLFMLIFGTLFTTICILTFRK